METEKKMAADPSYAWTTRLAGRTLGDARQLVAEALKTQGFGVLTEIDVRATMQQKLGREHRPYLILGACNPNLAYQALTTQPFAGLLLPCNVCLWEEGGGTTVSIARPKAMFAVVDDAAVRPVADEAERLLERAFQLIAQTVPNRGGTHV